MTASKLRQSIISLSPVEQTTHLIAILRDHEEFQANAREADRELKERDTADDEALSLGIEHARARGLLLVDRCERQWRQVVVDGLYPADIADLIVHQFPASTPVPRLVAVAGPSGIGKGAVVAALTTDIPTLSIWSNGDAFRFLTYLLLSSADQPSDGPADLSQSTIGVLADALQIDESGQLAMRRNDTVITLRDVPDRELRSVRVSRLVPQVARFSQGQVIALTNAASQAQPSGHGLLVEGRKPTLNYLDAEVHVELVLNNRAELGARRAAQRVVATLLSEPLDSEETMDSVLRRARR
ncbi:MAG: (d)CMP kinase [Candidatus Eisenbacteria bacterium]|nr:(d)CMP kinase [Candidatus Eisenbacteria bacterium]